MTELESMPSPSENITRPQFKISNRPEIQEVVDKVEEIQEIKHPHLDDAHTIRQIARDIAAPTILAERRAQKLKTAKAESRHDEVTGLLNRRGWEEQLTKAKARSERDGTPLCILLGDIRGLGEMNNSISMEAGDALIKASAEVLKDTMREGDEVARWGGDEFGIIYSNTTLEQALIAGTRVTNQLAEPQLLTFIQNGEQKELVVPIGFRAAVGEIDPANAQTSEAAIKEELSNMKNEEKALKAQGKPIGGNKIISLSAKRYAA